MANAAFVFARQPAYLCEDLFVGKGSIFGDVESKSLLYNPKKYYLG
jgi:hypothetical protein